MVGTNFQNPNMRWAKITNINELHESSIHGHIFVLTDGGFRAYEFQDSPLPDFTNVGRDFLVEFARYVLDHNLADLIGLQVLGDGPCNNRGMSELILDQGTIILDNSLIKNCEPTCITGWSFQSCDGNLRACMANETHSKMTTGNPKVFNAGKPLPKLENGEDLKAAFVEAGVM